MVAVDPGVPGLDVAGFVLPASDEVGGDFYDVFKILTGGAGDVAHEPACLTGRRIPPSAQPARVRHLCVAGGYGPGASRKRLRAASQASG